MFHPTPGPWRVQFPAIVSDKHHVCQVYKYFAKDIEAESNAKLIAKSQEMYALLTEIMHEAQQYTNDTGIVVPWCNKTEKLIAELKGY